MSDADIITDVDTLEALYGAPGKASVIKVTDRLTPAYRTWIGRSRFCVVSTVGPAGTDGSPRGGRVRPKPCGRQAAGVLRN